MPKTSLPLLVDKEAFPLPGFDMVEARYRFTITEYPRHRENRENGGGKHPCQGKHREFGNFAKTQVKHREFGFLKL